MKRQRPIIFISTCEFSGDMHGAVLITEIKKLLPEAEFYGVGGKQMAAAGTEIIFDPTAKSTLGFVEAIKNLGMLNRLIKEIAKKWDQRKPDLLLWLDSGGFNLKLALEAKKRGIPVVCMFSPSAWAYWEGRAVKLAERVSLLLAVLPFEADYYRKFGVKATYVGHPLVDRIGIPDAAAFRKGLGVDSSQKLVALMPGSRKQEISSLLPTMLEAAQDVSKDLNITWVLPLAGSINREQVESLIKESYHINLVIITEGVYDLLAAADGAVIASGTATLEAGILGVPMVIVYQLAKLSLFIYRRLQTKEQKARPPIIGLPNLILGREVFPELKQEQVTAANIAMNLRRILTDAQYNDELRKQLQIVKDKTGTKGAMTRAATEITALVKKVAIENLVIK
ncbi:MAG TPA: lipid-A-disaccharide synthase [Firmicutes bacterium]|jgi:lipid-A-disaccharide synthase|nr:lipid-A-disaccharide synthase [Bacillota bacterium]